MSFADDWFVQMNLFRLDLKRMNFGKRTLHG